MAEEFDQKKSEERHGAWERAHEIGSPTHRLRAALVLKAVRRIEQQRRDETTMALAGMSGRFLKATDFVYSDSGPGACLDAGCGAGEFALTLAGRRWKVTAFDPSEYAIDIARKAAARLGRDVEFVVAGVDEFQPEDSFNLVLGIDILEHIEDDGAAMARLASFLSPSGALLVTVPMDPTLWSGADEFSGHYRRYTRESLAELAAGAGLRVEHALAYGYPFTRMMWRAKRRIPGADARVVAAAGGGGAKRLGAHALSKMAIVLTSIDRLFVGGAEKGVGLVAVCRHSRH